MILPCAVAKGRVSGKLGYASISILCFSSSVSCHVFSVLFSLTKIVVVFSFLGSDVNVFFLMCWLMISFVLLMLGMNMNSVLDLCVYFLLNIIQEFISGIQFLTTLIILFQELEFCCCLHIKSTLLWVPPGTVLYAPMIVVVVFPLWGSQTHTFLSLSACVIHNYTHTPIFFIWRIVLIIC